MKKIALITCFLYCFPLYAQSSIVEKDLMVFQPSDFSSRLSKAYSENMFFGLFGLKPFIKSLNLNNSNVKTVTVTDVYTKKIVYKAEYSKENSILYLELTDQVATPIKVKYSYKAGVIESEIIEKKGEEQKVNHFFYNQDKMYIKNANKLFDIVWLEEDLLMKKTYLEQKIGFEDRLENNCRITSSLNQDINKTCYSSLIFKVPLKAKEYIPNVRKGEDRINLVEGPWTEIKMLASNKYQILKDNQPQFEVGIDQNRRLQEFKFLGNRTDKQQPLQFNFAYTFYK